MVNWYNVLTRSALVFTMEHMIWRFSLMKPSTGCSIHGTAYKLGEWCSKYVESYQTMSTTKCYLPDAQDVQCCDWFDTDWLVDCKNNSSLFLQLILQVWCALLHCSVSILWITDYSFEHARFSRYYTFADVRSVTEHVVNPHLRTNAFLKIKYCQSAGIISLILILLLQMNLRKIFILVLLTSEAPVA